MKLWLDFALRDLRQGLRGFWIFLLCVILGTAAIAGIGSLSAALKRGLVDQGQPLLGGDIEVALLNREATDEQRNFLRTQGTLSEVATMRAMAVLPGASTLVELKAVDGLYPFFGTFSSEPVQPLASALGGTSGQPGLLGDPLLAQRLGLKTGDSLKIGQTAFIWRGEITKEPDRLADGITLGPRALTSMAAFRSTGLVQPGSLIHWRYRLRLPQGADLKATVKSIETAFPQAGWQIRTRERAARGTDEFVDRLGFFMSLVGLTALVAGGAGIANAVSAHLDSKTGIIATLKCLGAPSRTIFGIFMMQILLLAMPAILLGMALGGATPFITASLFGASLPLPLGAKIEPVPLLTAGAFGLLVTLAFSIWPIARTRAVAASALFRDRIVATRVRPALRDVAPIVLALAGIIGLAYTSFGNWKLTSAYFGGLAVSLALLFLLARLIVFGAARLPRPRSAILAYALGNLHRPSSPAPSIILALGLGLTLFVTLVLMDATVSRELQSGIPQRAPAFFFLDVRKQDEKAFVALARAQPGVTDVQTAPMLRGRIVAVKSVPADKVVVSSGQAWVLRGDRGLTFSATVPQGSKLVAGQWWTEGYRGPPLVSLADEVAEGLGVGIGDEITVNVLGRDITARIASLRAVNWRSVGINFVMVFSPNTLEAAPYTALVTVAMRGGDEGYFVNTMTRAWPGTSAVSVKDAIAALGDLLEKLLTAIRGANVLTLVMGLLVLAGALMTGLDQRIYDAAVLKTCGATRGRLVAAFVAEYALLGLASGLFGLAAGTALTFVLAWLVLDVAFVFAPLAAVGTVIVAVVVTVAAGLGITWQALSVKPAALLRNG